MAAWSITSKPVVSGNCYYCSENARAVDWVRHFRQCSKLHRSVCSVFTRTSYRAPSPVSIDMKGSHVGSGRPLLLQGCTGPSLPNQLRGSGWLFHSPSFSAVVSNKNQFYYSLGSQGMK